MGWSAAHRQNVRSASTATTATRSSRRRAGRCSEAENASPERWLEGGGLDPSDLELILAEKRQAVPPLGDARHRPRGDELRRRRRAGPARAVADQAHRHRRPPRRRTTSRRRSGPTLLTGVPGCVQEPVRGCRSRTCGGRRCCGWTSGAAFAGLVGSSEKNIRTVIRTARGSASRRACCGHDEIEQLAWPARWRWWRWRHRAPRVRHVPAVDAGEDGAGVRDGHREPGRLAAAGVPARRPVRRDSSSICRRRPSGPRSGGSTCTRRVTDPSSASDAAAMDDALFAELADVSAGYSGAEIEQAAPSGLVDAFAEEAAAAPGRPRAR